MNTTTVPPHLSETLFRYFEPHIALAVRSWPKDTAFDTRLLPVDERYAPTTFVGRFRDAILSLKRFAWDTTMIDKEKLWGMSGLYVIALEPGTGVVWFRQRQKQQRPSHMIGEARARGYGGGGGGDGITPAASSPSFGVVPLEDLTGEELDAIVVLLGGQRCVGPVFVRGNTWTMFPSRMDAWMTNFDVAFTWDEKAGVTVIT